MWCADDLDLSDMQADAAEFRPTPCTILRNVSVGDGMGGLTDTWSVINTTTCRIQFMPLTLTEVVSEGRIEGTTRWLIALAPGTDVTNRDRIAAQGLTYEVTGLQGPITFEIERLVQCQISN